MVRRLSPMINQPIRKVSVAPCKCRQVTSVTAAVVLGTHLGVAMAVHPLPSPTLEQRMVSAMKQDQTAVRSQIQVETSSLLEELVAERLSSMQKSSKSTEQLMLPDKMENKDIPIRTDLETVVLVQEQVPVEASSCLPTN